MIRMKGDFAVPLVVRRVLVRAWPDDCGFLALMCPYVGDCAQIVLGCKGEAGRWLAGSGWAGERG